MLSEPNVMFQVPPNGALFKRSPRTGDFEELVVAVITPLHP